MRHMTIQLLQNSSKYYDLPQKDKTVKLPLKDISCRPTPAVSYDSNKPATYSVLVHKPHTSHKWTDTFSGPEGVCLQEV